MSKLTRSIGILVTIALVCAGAAALGGCAKSGESAGKAFLNYISSKDYDKAYQLLGSKAQGKISEDDFTKKYTAIYNALEVSGLKLDFGEYKSAPKSGTLPCGATLQSGLMGDTQLSLPVSLVNEDGEWKVDWTPALILPDMDWGDTVVVTTVKAERGEIFDCNGVLLAANSYAETVYAIPSKVSDISAAANKLASPLGMSQDDIIKKLGDGTATGIVSIKAFEKGTLTDEAKQTVLSVAGFGIDKSSLTKVRSYDVPNGFAHTVGYLGSIPSEQLQTYLDKGYSSSEEIGVAGLEAAYEDQLHGKDGKEAYIKDSGGNRKKTLYKVDKQDGLDLHLTVDITIQQKAQEAMDQYMASNQGGAVIVMDSETGDILCMADHPSYDPNIFSFPITQAEWDALNASDAGQPLYNRATRGLYPPGSVIKPFTAAAALESGTITSSTTFDGEIVDNYWTPTTESWPYPAIKRYEDSGTPLNLDRAITESDNIYFAWVALRMGDDKLLPYFEKYGYGEAIPFALSVATSNLRNADTEFTRKLLADSGYGQGELLITPLQQAAMYCAFNMGGDIPVPRIAASLYETEGLNYVKVQDYDRQIWKSGVIAQSSINALIPMMDHVMGEGTGKGGRPSGSSAVGKTGTAEVGNDKSKEISWICAFETTGERKLLVMVMVEAQANTGSSIKLPICRTLLALGE